MENLLQKGIVRGSFPKQNEVVKYTTGDSIRFTISLTDDFLKSNSDIEAEVWTDIKGRFHGFPMKKTEFGYQLNFALNSSGLFKATFRFRRKQDNYWTWIAKSPHEGYSEIHVDDNYINNAIVYNAFIRFFGHRKIKESGMIEFGQSGTFDDIKHRLDELKSLGVDIIYLNPIHPIGEVYRNYNPHDLLPSYLQPGCPYSIKDYKSIDPELGIDREHEHGSHSSLSDPMREFKEFVSDAHKRNMKVYMDLVFNHTAHDFILQRLHPEWFLYKENIMDVNEPYIYPEEVKQGKPWGDPKHTVCPFDHGFFWEDAAQLNWEYMIAKAANEPPKNPTISDMYDYFKSIPKYWIRHIGIDGFRCDVAYRVPPDFWKACISEAKDFAKKEYPNNGALSDDVIFIAESYVDDVRELFESGFTAVYGDYSNKLYSPLTLKGYLDYMYNLSGEFFPRGSRFFIFPECHDFHRNTMKILDNPNDILAEHANKSRWVLTATLPGLPMIFNGFEKLEWHNVNLFSYSDINWEADSDLTRLISKVNSIRKKHKALQTGDYIWLENSQGLNENASIFSHARKSDKSTFIIAVNMDVNNKSCASIRLSNVLGIDFSKEYVLNDLLGSRKYKRHGNELYVELEPGESHIFRVEQK